MNAATALAAQVPPARGVMAGVRPASLVKIAGAVTLDVLLVIAIPGFATAVGGNAASVALAGVLVLAVLTIQFGGLVLRGRSLGCHALGLRLVSADTGSALGRRVKQAWQFADIRRGRDPITPFVPVPILPVAGYFAAPVRPAAAIPLSDPGAVAEPLQQGAAHAVSALPQSPALPLRSRRQASTPLPASPVAQQLAEPVEATIVRPPARQRHDGAVLVIDRGRRVPVTTGMVVGRNPIATGEESVVAIPDLSRLLSKTHLRIEQERSGAVFVTDLASTNGSAFELPDGSVTALAPHARTQLPADAIVLIGDHTLAIERRTPNGQRSGT